MGTRGAALGLRGRKVKPRLRHKHLSVIDSVSTEYQGGLESRLSDSRSSARAFRHGRVCTSGSFFQYPSHEHGFTDCQELSEVNNDYNLKTFRSESSRRTKQLTTISSATSVSFTNMRLVACHDRHPSAFYLRQVPLLNLRAVCAATDRDAVKISPGVSRVSQIHGNHLSLNTCLTRGILFLCRDLPLRQESSS